MRVDGDITFHGVLRIQGAILGDVSCDADGRGTIVVGQSGNVHGAVIAPHIVVGGQVSGPARSSESIEIQAGACLTGDTRYKMLAISPGGIIEGSLLPDTVARAAEEPMVSVAHSVSLGEHDNAPSAAMPAGGQSEGRSWKRPLLGASAALLVAMLVVVLVSRDPPSNAPASAELPLRPGASINEPALAQASLPGSGGLPSSTSSGSAEPVALLPKAGVAEASVAPATVAENLGTDTERVVLVQGVNPRKPTDVFSVTSAEPSVILRKKRQEKSGGTRVEISKGEKVAIPIGKNEIVRVVEGHNIMIFYQGRKVSPKVIASGAWLSFQPHSATP